MVKGSPKFRKILVPTEFDQDSVKFGRNDIIFPSSV